jgi:hypothetical protein
MKVTDKQKEAAKKVINVARLLELALREAERAGLKVHITHYNHDSTIKAEVYLREEVTLATTEQPY